MTIDSKKIAKNTVFLYIRLILVFGVTLYTSRVVLDKLGVDDFGLYNVVFSVIGLLSFLIGTLSAGTSRFITFDLGKNDKENLKITFSTSLCAHFLLAGIILLLGETLGIWYINNVMVCPPERFHAAFIVYQISILTTVVSILQVPFNSEIIAHEEMDIYAYIGIYEAVAKLVAVFFLVKSPFDKMVFYASLIAVVNVSVFLIYVYYCCRKFEEVRFAILLDKKILREILYFSGWNILANLSNTVMKQGVIVLFNAFFAPVVVAAQALANQISQAMMQFVDSVRQAVNPQVIKLYADEKYKESRVLTIQSAEYIFDILLLFGVPCIMLMPKLLVLWLVNVPDYSVEFARLVIIENILGNFSSAFYTPMVAANKIQKNSIVALILCFIQFGLLYYLFNIGLGAIWARYIGIVFCIIWSFIVKPYILWKDIDYRWEEMFVCFGRCIRTLLIVIICCYALFEIIPQISFIHCFIQAVLAMLVIVITTYMFMTKSMKDKIRKTIRNRCF